MRYPLAILALLLGLSSCEEKDLSTDNPAPDPENIVINASFIYGTSGLNRDTLYTNSLGQNFYIDDIRLIFSDFSMFAGSDTVIKKEGVFQLSFDDREEPLVFLEPGGYSLQYGLRLGVDSLQGALLSPNELEAQDDDIDPELVFRGDGSGINHLIIEGRLLDSSNPQDSNATIPVQYFIGTYMTSRAQTSDVFNFSVERTSRVPLIVLVDIEPIFNDFDLKARPLVETQISNPVDLAYAMEISDSLRLGLF